MKFKRVAIKDIRPATYNPRKKLVPTDKEYQSLRLSLQEFGAVEPLIVNKRTGNLVGGHQRLQVMKDMGEKIADVVEVDLDPKKEKALNVALNKITGRWDKRKLKDLLVDLDVGAFDIQLTGFDAEDLKELMEEDDDTGTGPEDRVPPLRKKAVTKPGWFKRWRMDREAKAHAVWMSHFDEELRKTDSKLHRTVLVKADAMARGIVMRHYDDKGIPRCRLCISTDQLTKRVLERKRGPGRRILEKVVYLCWDHKDIQLPAPKTTQDEAPANRGEIRS